MAKNTFKKVNIIFTSRFITKVGTLFKEYLAWLLFTYFFVLFKEYLAWFLFTYFFVIY